MEKRKRKTSNFLGLGVGALVVFLLSSFKKGESGDQSKGKVTFENTINHLLDSEGSCENVQNDKGGLTCWGITIKYNPEYFKNGNRPSREQATEFYRKLWKIANIDAIPDRLRYLVFSHLVNRGLGSTIKRLQSLAKVKADGKIGPKTAEAVEKVSNNDYTKDWKQRYIDRIDSDSSQEKFRNGWYNRINNAIDLTKQLLS